MIDTDRVDRTPPARCCCCDAAASSSPSTPGETDDDEDDVTVYKVTHAVLPVIESGHVGERCVWSDVRDLFPGSRFVPSKYHYQSGDRHTPRRVP